MSDLYTIHVNLQAMLEGMHKAIEDGDEDVQKLYADTYESLRYDFESKLEGCVKYVRNQTSEAEMYEAEAKYFQDKARACKNRAKRTKDLMEFCMNAEGLEKANAGLFKVWMQKNGGKKPLIVNVDPEELPDEFRAVEYKADSDAIREALDNGYEGDLFQYGEVGKSLRFK